MKFLVISPLASKRLARALGMRYWRYRRTAIFLTGEDYLALSEVAPPQWILEDILPAGGMCNLYGSPKAGKSFLALGIAEAVSTGRREVLGIPVKMHGPVCYLQIDTPRGEWLRRVRLATKEGFNFSKIHFADKESGTPFPFNIITDWPVLKQFLDQIQPILVIIDTLRESFRGDENDSGVMQNVIAHIVKSMPMNCAGMLLSHRRKESTFDADDIMSSARGSNYISGRMDAIMYLKNDELRYVSRSIELQTLDVMQYPKYTGKSGMVHLNPEEAKVMTALEKVVRLLKPSSAEEQINMAEVGRQLHAQMGGQMNGKTYSEKSTDAFRKAAERRMDKVMHRINSSVNETLP